MMTIEQEIRAVLDWMDGGPEPDWPEPEIELPSFSRSEAYGDWYVYADGREEFRSVGD